jgi:hypothetical protein
MSVTHNVYMSVGGDETIEVILGNPITEEQSFSQVYHAPDLHRNEKATNDMIEAENATNTIQTRDESIPFDEGSFESREELEVNRQEEKTEKKYNETANDKNSKPKIDHPEVKRQMKNKLTQCNQERPEIPQLSKTVNEIAEVDRQLQALLKNFKTRDADGNSINSVSTASTLECDTISVDSNTDRQTGGSRKKPKEPDTPPSMVSLPPLPVSKYKQADKHNNLMVRKSGIVPPKLRIQIFGLGNTSERKLTTLKTPKTGTTSKMLEPQCFGLDGGPTRAMTYVALYDMRSPPSKARIAKGPTCTSKYVADLHEDRMECERCLGCAAEEENTNFKKEGGHVRIMQVRGGCGRNCKIFPRESDEHPVRLCAKCFHDTHYDTYYGKANLAKKDKVLKK